MAVPGSHFITSSHFWAMRDCGHLEAAKQPLNIPPRRPGCKPTSRTTKIYIQQYVQTHANTSAHAYARMYVHSHTQHICNTHMRTPRVTHYVCSAHTHTANGETHKQIDSQTDTKGDRQTDTQTHKQTDRHTLCACITHTTHRQLTVHILQTLHTSKHQTHSIVHHTHHTLYIHTHYSRTDTNMHRYTPMADCMCVPMYTHMYMCTHLRTHIVTSRRASDALKRDHVRLVKRHAGQASTGHAFSVGSAVQQNRLRIFDALRTHLLGLACEHTTHTHAHAGN